MSIIFNPGRDEDMGVDLEAASKRVKKLNESLGQDIDRLSAFVAEGWVMNESSDFHNGVDLAHYTTQAAKFVLASLMEKGMLAKRLPKAKAVEKVESHGTYL